MLCDAIVVIMCMRIQVILLVRIAFSSLHEHGALLGGRCSTIIDIQRKITLWYTVHCKIAPPGLVKPFSVKAWKLRYD